TPHQTEIRFIEDERLLKITFSDGEQYDYETPILRGYCPCAHCQGHGSMPHKFNKIRNESAIVIDDISQVGAYAICIAWADGHNTGVYSFEMLRQIANEPEEILEDYPPEETGL
ncbi:MAG: gamma-butyrobetaine hydroxylase-like domain-containing protein, partial [Bradymonadaceae bacterium]